MAAGDLLTGNYQIEWNGLLLGASSTYGLKKLDGWLDNPSARVGTDPKSGRHGAYPGLYLSDYRVITVDLLIRGLVAPFQAAVKALRAATTADENASEIPLVIQWDGRKQFVNARVARRMIPATYDRYPLGQAPASIQWIATDPRIYEIPASFVTTGLATVVGGLQFPIQAPFDFGAGNAGGIIVVTNTGNASAWPIFTLSGPLVAPAITNTASGKQLAFKSTTTIPLGQSWTIDTNLRTVNVTGTTTTRNNELLIRQWFSIPPVSSVGMKLTSGTYDANAQLGALLYNTDM